MTTAPAKIVPSTPEELLDPAWLVSALDDLSEDDNIVRVDRTDSTKTRAEKARFVVTIDRGDDVEVRYYCAKAHLDGTPSMGMTTECRYYRDLAPRLSIRGARVPYVAIDEDAGAAILVMEDLVAQGALFMNPHRPFPVEVARASLSELARLHGTTWGLEPVADVDWLMGNGMKIGVMFPPEALQALFDDGRGAGLPPGLDSGERLAAAVKIQAALPDTCMLHGDTHTGNWYVDAEGRPCLFDWEIVQKGHWSQDVAYHLSTVLSIEDRRAHERELLDHYLSELVVNGGPVIDPDEAWEQYRRGFAYGYLLWVITQVRGRDELLADLERIAAAIDDHHMYELLGV